MELNELPTHEASLTLVHNDHKNNYLTVAEAIEQEVFGYTEECWVSEAERLRAIESNDCWSLQWYPNSPVGFYILAAHSLDALLEAAKKV